MTKNSSAAFFANHIAPKLSAQVDPMVTLPGGATMKLSDYLKVTEAATAPAKKPASRKAPAPVATLPVTKSEPVVQSGPVDYELAGKKNACFKAAKAAVRAAGLAWNGKSGAESKGGEYSKVPEERTAYWTAYWAGYNAKAVELGIPVSTPPAK